MVPLSTTCDDCDLSDPPPPPAELVVVDLLGLATGVARPDRKLSSLPAAAGRGKMEGGLAVTVKAGTAGGRAQQRRIGPPHPTALPHAAAPDAASTRPRKRGEGLKGRDLNSGWNWAATKKGCPLSSTISMRVPLSSLPTKRSPAASNWSTSSGLTSYLCIGVQWGVQ